MPAPRISVIICTHNRRKRLLVELEALAAQDLTPDSYEVIVVADSCSDGTVRAVAAAAHRFPFKSRFAECAARNAGVARNLGARMANGEFLLFLDDDMLPVPGLLSAHMRGHERHEVVVGYAKPELPETPQFWHCWARIWWEGRFSDMARPNHRFSYKDFFSGNVSLPRRLFEHVGGFDASLRRLEDYELGLRLIKAGVRFTFEPAALALHHESGDQWSWVRRMSLEAESFARMGEKHPEMRGRLHEHLEQGTWSDRLRWLALHGGALHYVIQPALRAAVMVFEAIKLRGFWQKSLGALGEYTFWRGSRAARMHVEGALPTELAVANERSNEGGLLRVEIAEAGEWKYDHGALAGVRELNLFMADVPVLRIRNAAGFEPLEERHLCFPLDQDTATNAILWESGPELGGIKTRPPENATKVDLSSGIAGTQTSGEDAVVAVYWGDEFLGTVNAGEFLGGTVPGKGFDEWIRHRLRWSLRRLGAARFLRGLVDKTRA